MDAGMLSSARWLTNPHTRTCGSASQNEEEQTVLQPGLQGS
jgi:hypothetical protein